MNVFVASIQCNATWNPQTYKGRPPSLGRNSVTATASRAFSMLRSNLIPVVVLGVILALAAGCYAGASVQSFAINSKDSTVKKAGNSNAAELAFQQRTSQQTGTVDTDTDNNDNDGTVDDSTSSDEPLEPVEITGTVLGEETVLSLKVSIEEGTFTITHLGAVSAQYHEPCGAAKLAVYEASGDRQLLVETVGDVQMPAADDAFSYGIMEVPVPHTEIEGGRDYFLVVHFENACTIAGLFGPQESYANLMRFDLPFPDAWPGGLEITTVGTQYAVYMIME